MLSSIAVEEEVAGLAIKVADNKRAIKGQDGSVDMRANQMAQNDERQLSKAVSRAAKINHKLRKKCGIV